MLHLIARHYFFVSVAVAATVFGFSSRAAAETITWTGPGANSFGLTAGSTSNTASNPCNSETVTAVFTNPNSAALAPFPGLTGGGTVPYMGMNATAVNQSTQMELTFGGGQPVENLTFTIYDIDQQNGSGSAWTDVITVTAFFGPTAVAITATCTAGTCTHIITGSGTTTAIFSGDTNNPTFLDAPGQGDLSIAGPVDRVVVHYNASGPGTNNQYIGFTDFTFNCSTTPVTVSRFEAQRLGGDLIAEWTTAAETGNVGFDLFAEISGDWRKLNRQLIPSHQLDSLVPQDYRVNLGTRATEARRFMLAEVDRRGRRRMHGPFALGSSFGGDKGQAGASSAKDRAIDWASIRALHERLAAGRSKARAIERHPRDDYRLASCDLRVSKTGLYRVTYEELTAAGCELGGAPVAELALTQGATPVAIRLTSRDERFGPGDQVEFLGRRLDSIYTRTNVYRLSADASKASRILERRGTADGIALDHYAATRWVEEERLYSFSSPTDDPWYAEAILAYTSPVHRELPLQVDELLAGPAQLHVELWGVTDHPDVTLDHHVEVALNGVVLDELLFAGLSQQRLDAELPPGLLHEGENTLTLTLPGDTGAPFDLVHLDRYGVTYRRRTRAMDDRLTLRARAPQLTVSDLSSPHVVIYAESGRRLRYLTQLEAAAAGSGYAVHFSANARQEQSYWVSTTEALLSPQLSPSRQPRNLLDGRADYLVISHASFIDQLSPLLAARQAQGLTTKVVEVEDLYARYTGGVFDPQAIRKYLVEAADQLGVRMVLLVGGDTYDYLDHLGIGSMSFIPTFYATTHPVVRYAPADSLLADLDGDGVQDLALGRLPVRTLDELETMLDKTLAFSTTSRTALFAADANDGRVSFSAASDEMALCLPADWSIERAYLDEMDLPGARAKLIGALQAGLPLVSYIGHSGPMSWSFDNLLTANDASNLTNFTNPSLILAWGCWNGYHSVPQYNTLSHELLLARGGAAALLGASGLTEASSDRALANALLTTAFDSAKTLGEAILEAKRQLSAQGGTQDVVVGMTLLGDPAIRLQ